MANQSGSASMEDLVKGLLKDLNEGMGMQDLLKKAVTEGARLGSTRTRDRLKAMLDTSTAADTEEDLVFRKVPKVKGAKGLVQCPVPDCKNSGVRTMNCFCKPHFESIKPAERLKLREAQIARKMELKRKKKLLPGGTEGTASPARLRGKTAA